MGKIAVIAEEDVATCFKAAGVKLSFPVRDESEAVRALASVLDMEEVSIVVITEPIAEWPRVKPIVEEASRRVHPTLITIPGREGPAPGKRPAIMDLVKRTIGIEIKI